MERISDERLKELIGRFEAHKPFGTVVEDAEAAVLPLFRELLALREESKWIACSERMPDEFVDILIAIPLWEAGEYLLDGGKGKPSSYHFAVGDHEAGGFLAEDECYDPENVTHWRPLPSAPEGGTNGK